jgi:hypothetical protein
VRDILDIGSADAAHSETVTLEPGDAARRIVDQLTEWGYLPTPTPNPSEIQAIEPAQRD